MLRDVTYGYDAKDNPVSGTDALAAGNAESYGYSPADRLVSAQGPWGSLGWSHDGVGNRLSQVRDPGASSGTGAVTESYGYGATSNRLASVTAVPGGTRSFSHDGAGNVVLDDRGNGEVWGYGYDAAGRLASVSLNGAERARYLYDHLGQQIQRTLLPAGAVIHSVFDRDGHRIAEYDAGTGALIREYVWLDDLPVAVIEGTTTPTVYFVRADAIGRPVFATTSAGTVVWSASYLPFGEVRVSAGAPIDLRFPGQWFQLESGLHQNWMRDYDPTTGRYIEADPLGLVDGASVYGYARQSPGRFIDPRGEFLETKPGGGVQLTVGDAPNLGGGGGGAWYPSAPSLLALGSLLGLGSDMPAHSTVGSGEAEDCCRDIYERIDRAVSDMRRRFLHMAKNRRDQPVSHAAEILARQRGLRKMIDEPKARGCLSFDKRAYYCAWAPVPGPGSKMPEHIR